MKTTNLLTEAMSSIIINKGRSLLTILGVIIGIAAVTAIIGLGGGVDDKVKTEIKKLGSRNLTIQSRNAPTTAELEEKNDTRHKPPEGSPEAQDNVGASVIDPSLTQADLLDLANIDSRLVSYLSPQINSTGRMSSSTGAISVKLIGVSEDYDEIRNYRLSSGIFLSSDNIGNVDKSIVLGRELARDLYGEKSPLEQSLVINDSVFTIIGVLDLVEASQFDDPNSSVFVPYTTLIQQQSGSTKLPSIVVQAKEEEYLAQLKQEVESILLTSHDYTKIEEADFTIQSSADLLSSFTSLTDLFRKVLMGSAAISLLVGGIGIMNIMLVSVTERTREIGLRKAVGAKTHHILMQFLTEAIVLTMTGGLIGAGVGQILAGAMAKVLDLGITPSIKIGTILITVGISVGIGLVFGIYPAMRAARLDPIDALRFE